MPNELDIYSDSKLALHFKLTEIHREHSRDGDEFVTGFESAEGERYIINV